MKNPIQQHIQVDAVKKVAHQFLGMENFSLIALLMAALFFLGAGWLPDAGTNLLLPGGQKMVGIYQLTGSLIVFSVFGLVISHKIKHQQQVKIVVSSPPSARILIIFLSSCNKQLLETLKCQETALLPEEIEGTSWEMPLLAIRHHAERLEQLYVFTSSGEQGTHQQFNCFHRIVSTAYPKLKIIELTGEGTDFEDMATIYDETDKLYERLDRTGIYASDDIILDITGGQKTNSIAAALATQADGRKFQYVSTKSKQVRSFDLVIEQKP